MKTVFMFVLATGFTACGASKDGNSNLKSIAYHAPDWGSVKMVRFFHDDRPVDGNLHEIILTKDANSKYDVVSRVISSTRGQPTRSHTTEIAKGLFCENAFADEIGRLTNVICIRDQRPVDGPLTKVLFDINSSGNYSSRKVLTTSGQSGPAATKVIELGTDLILENP